MPKKKATKRTKNTQGEIKPFTKLKKGQHKPRVSNKGRWSDTGGIIKTASYGAGGYGVVRIFSLNYMFSNIVCRAFGGKAPSPYHEVDHIDGP